MKDPREWDENYLLNLPAGEFDWIDFKNRKGLDLTIDTVRENDILDNLSKAISAFANSGGGNIVYGIKNPQPNRPLEVDDGGINSNIKNGTREWLEDVIPNLVDYPLVSFNVYTVKKSLHNSQIAPDRDIFVVQIPDSEQAPHQARDKKYYIRAGGKSVPIGHRSVMDIVGRRKHPVIKLEFEIHVSTYYKTEPFATYDPFTGRSNRELIRRVELDIAARNVGSIYAQYMNCFVYIPTSLGTSDEVEYVKEAITEIDGKTYFQWHKDNTHRDVLRPGSDMLGLPVTLGSSRFDPILPSLAYNWQWEINEAFDISKVDQEDQILWEVYADNAPVNKGGIFVKDIPFSQNED